MKLRDTQVLKDTLDALRLAERALEDVLAGKGSVSSCCAKYGLDGTRMRQLLYSIRTMWANKERKASREELGHALEERGHPDCVERLYKKTFQQIRSVGAKKAVRVMPPDASETVECICSHPSHFLLSDEEGEVLRAVHLDGYGLGKAAERLSYTNDDFNAVLKGAIHKLTTKRNARFLLYGLDAYKQDQEEIEAERRRMIEKAIKAQDAIAEEVVNIQKTIETQAAKIASKNMVYASISIDDMELSNRTTNALKRTGLKNLHQIMQLKYKELMKIRFMGEKTTREVIRKVREYVPGWIPEGMPEKGEE